MANKFLPDIQSAGRWQSASSPTSPATSDSISFISFIASTMQRIWPTSMVSPAFTNGGDPGDGDS